MIDSLLRWLRRLWLRLRRRSEYAEVRRVESMDDLPEQLGSAIYLVVRGGTARWAVFSCPCRCGDRIQVNLMTRQLPCWTLTGDLQSVTLQPSLWRAEGTCGSHFFIEHNRVRWV
jgi:hypothetical protein